ncbi:ALP1 (YNL270C) and CAN1 (YEL063C) [Zygosaccharomyces parabailii]|nr:ALP1 (YNL270C) and CAN1 (YEL063C) [Zygosaccharomyces parabailii]CDH09767.1 probable Arginine permease [Zygosaccharomyces bailii ISA1307]
MDTKDSLYELNEFEWENSPSPDNVESLDKLHKSKSNEESVYDHSIGSENGKSDSKEGDIDEEELSGEVQDAEVKRALKPRHIGMIALGGTIGTGLFIGIAEPLENAGPVGALISYLFMGTLAFSVVQSLGEMATFIPVTSSFTVFSSRFLSPAFGAANGYMYWFSWAITFALELSVIGQVIQYWTYKVPLAAWISIFWVLIGALNMCPVKFYGEFEFWVAFIKVVAIVGFIIYCFIMVCGAGKTGPVGFRYWRHGYAFGTGIISKDKNEARFLGWVSSLINAAFTYQGTELVGITAGEAANPRKTVPRAIKKTVFRILIFYILSLLFIGLLVPYNDPMLKNQQSYAASSPFIIAIKNSGTKVLPHIFNAVILTTVISAANSNVYVGSRVMCSLAKNKLAPRILGRINSKGVPYVSVLFTTAIGALAYMETSASGASVFNWLLNITGVAGFFAWLLICLSHLRFMKALKHRGISRDDLPFKAALMPGLAIYAAIFMVIIILIQGFTSFAPSFNASDFVAAYISVALFFVIWAAFQLYFRCPLLVPVEEIDIDSDRRDVEAVVWEEEPPKTLWDKFWNVVA